MNRGARVRKNPAAVMRGSQHDFVVLAPDGVERSIGCDHSGEAFGCAVVIPRQAWMSVDLNRLRPGLAVIGRAREHHLRIGNSPASPSYIEIAGEFAVGTVSDDPRLVFKGNARLRLLLGDWNMLCLPGFSAIERAANKNAVARRAARPVVETPEPIEGDVADEGVALIVECRRHVARHTIVLGIDVFGELPGAAGVL